MWRDNKEANQVLAKTFHETYSDLVGSMAAEAEYDVVLLERGVTDGLSKKEIFRLLAYLSPDKEYYPVEFPATSVESYAMGFISSEAAGEAFDFDYGLDSALHKFVGAIMDDVDKETPDHVYDFRTPNGCALKVYLDR